MEQNIIDDLDAWNVVFIIHFDKKDNQKFSFYKCVDVYRFINI